MTHTRPLRVYDTVTWCSVTSNLNLASDLFILKNHDDTLFFSLGAFRFIPFSTLLMWAKLSNALKPRLIVEETESPPQAVVSPVQEKHPDLSALRNNDDGENKAAEVPFPAPAPPGSPSRHRNGVFRRLSRSTKHDTGEPSKSSSARKLPLLLPKKAKSQVSLHTSGTYIPVWPCSAIQ